MSTIYDPRMRAVASAAGASTSEHLGEPLITALLPVKDYHERYLHKALRSVVAQTSPAWQMIVIGEEDGREALATVLEQYFPDPRIELIANEHRGYAGAFNTGMEHARTPFAAILLGDDMWSQDAVAVLSDHIRSRPEAEFFHSSRMVIDEDDRPLSPVYRSSEEVSLDPSPGHPRSST